jgi:hypothetical protein
MRLPTPTTEDDPGGPLQDRLHSHGLPFSMSTAFVDALGRLPILLGRPTGYRARSLEPATRVLLVTAGRPLGHDVVDFCLKRFGYRYNVASLRNAVARSENVVWQDGFWDHYRGDDAEWDLLHDIAILPEGQWDYWGPLRNRIVRVHRRGQECRRAQDPSHQPSQSPTGSALTGPPDENAAPSLDGDRDPGAGRPGLFGLETRVGPADVWWKCQPGLAPPCSAPRRVRSPEGAGECATADAQRRRHPGY